MAVRRKRRTKAQIEADKLKEEAKKAEEQRLIDAGYEKVRTRDEHGHFIKDDPSTPENEAWEWRKVEETPEPTPAPTPEPAPKKEPSPEPTPEPVPTPISSPTSQQVIARRAKQNAKMHATCRWKEKRGHKRGLW